MAKQTIKFSQTWPALIFLLIIPAEFFVHYLLRSLELTFLTFTIYNSAIIFLLLVICFLVFMYMHLKYLKTNKLDTSSVHDREERYRMIFENVQDVYYEVTGDGIILEISPSVKYISKGQYEREELLGKSVYSLYFDSNERDQLLLILKSKGSVADHEIKLKNKDGSVFQCSVSAKLLMSENNQQAKITGIMRDISLRKQAEESIRQKNEELKLINSEKDKLFSIIAHDLRTPFNAFIGLTEIMVRKCHTISSEEIHKFAGSMHTTAINLHSLLENLLLWSGNRQGTIPFEVQELSLQSLIMEGMVAVKESAERKDIKLVYSVPENIRVLADLNAFHTILRNLVSNAIKFTHRNGRINISARETGTGQVEISCADTGIGIEPEVLDKLFSIHSKANRLGTEGEPSTGLGLLLCKEFVEKHGGNISVSSEPGSGSTFAFTLYSAN